MNSLEYLQDIKKRNFLDNDELADILQDIAYILGDNGHDDARYFLEDVIDTLEE